MTASTIPPVAFTFAIHVVALPGRAEGGVSEAENGDTCNKHQAENDAGKDPGHKELPDGFLHQDAVNNEDRAGRDHDSQGSGSGDGARGQGVVIFVFLHFRKGDFSHGGGRGRRGTAYGRKTGAGQHRRNGQAPPEAAPPRYRWWKRASG